MTTARDAVRGLGLEPLSLPEATEMSTIAETCRAFDDLASCLDSAPPKLTEARMDDGRQFAWMVAEDLLSTLLTYFPKLNMDVIRHGPIWSRKRAAEASIGDVAEYVAENFDPEARIIYPDSPSGRRIMPTSEEIDRAAKSGVPWIGIVWSGWGGSGGRSSSARRDSEPPAL